jgi:hypothetical protein
VLLPSISRAAEVKESGVCGMSGADESVEEALVVVSTVMILEDAQEVYGATTTVQFRIVVGRSRERSFPDQQCCGRDGGCCNTG